MKKKIYILTALASLVLLSSPLISQRTKSIIKRKRPVIIITKPGTTKKEPIKLHDLKIKINVVGNLATTTMDMTYYNPHNRVLEGRFYFPLKEGQTVSGFSLEVNGRMRKGVVVEKTKGRKVFESVVRSMIDPGLLEWTKGNNFKARIYPIPAKGYKRLRISYEEDLTYKRSGFLYRLPLAFQKRIKNFKLIAKVYKQQFHPKININENQLVNFRFGKWGTYHIAKFIRSNYLANKQLAFFLPRTKAYKTRVTFYDKIRRTGFFYLHLTPKKIVSNKKLPNKITLLWDASSSMQKRDTKKELRLLDSYFKRIKNSTVELVIFRNKIDSKETFHIKSGNWFNLKKRLLRVQYDGGTSLGQLDLTKFNCDEFILVSDGISNFGKSEIKLSNVPVITISSSLTAQHSYLRYISQKSGGVQINLAEITINNALRAMTTQPFSFIKATYNQGTISETYPSLPTVVHNDFSISGKIHTQSALITLHFGYAGKTLYTKKIWINQKRDAIKKEIVTRIWAQKKIYQLEMRPKKNELLITTLGKAHNIVTRFTSLIVLERLSDYVKYRIVPPSELQTAYYNAINRIAKSKRVKKISHLETIVKKFQRLQLWWQKRYPLDTPKIKISPKKSLRNGSTRRSAERRARRPVRTGDERDLNTISRSSNSAAGKNSKQKPKGNSSSITLKKWSPDTPYLRNLKKVSLKDMYNTYISLKKNYANSSAFYLDVADLFIAKNKRMLALRILSNIAEMKLENPQLLRILAHRLAQLKENKLSISVFKEVLGMRKEDPQSYRDLALVLSRDGQNQKAIELLYKVGTSKWDSRFPEIELIALNEMNSIIGRFPNLNTSTIDRRLIRHMPVDVRVVLNWDADNTDMDLWVFDPNKEKCYYAHRFTYQGGRMSRDFTRGYGPEVYMVRRAKDGNYTIKVNYYGNRQQIIAGATTVQMQLFLNYGRPNQTMKEITLRLKNKREVITVGSFKIRFGHK